MQQKVVIGVAGMPGAGKAVLRSSAEGMGCTVVIMGDEIREETKRRGLDPTPENVGKVMIELRKEEGATTVAKRCIPKIKKAQSNIVLVDGIRSLDEVDEFKRHFSNFSLIAAHSSPEARFQRLSRRKRSDDPNGWNVFHERDLRELSVGQGDVIALADFMLVNEGTYDEFKAEATKALQTVIQKWKK